MTKKQYEKQCKKLFEKAKSYGLTLEFAPEFFDCKRLNCLWYGGELATIRVSAVLDIELNVYGGVYAALFDKRDKQLARVKDKNDSGRFSDEMMPFIKNDRQLQEALDKGRLILDNNNWIEYDGVIHGSESDSERKFVDLGMICDNILDDNILTAIDFVLDDHKKIADEIMEVSKSYGC